MTRLEMRSYVLDRLGLSSAETDQVVHIDRLLGIEYLRVARQERLTVDTADLVFTASDPLVDLPDDFMEVISLRRGSEPLRPVTRERLMGLVADREGTVGGTGPLVYAFESPSRIRVEPAPGENDPAGASLTYVAKPASSTVLGAYGLAADADVPTALPEEFHDLLAELVIERMALADEEAGLAGAARTIAEGLRAELRSGMSRRGGVGVAHIRPRGLRAR